MQYYSEIETFLHQNDNDRIGIFLVVSAGLAHEALPLVSKRELLAKQHALLYRFSPKMPNRASMCRR